MTCLLSFIRWLFIHICTHELEERVLPKWGRGVDNRVVVNDLLVILLSFNNGKPVRSEWCL